MPRSRSEEVTFRISLASMHRIYSHKTWVVFRLLTIPDDALNDTPYHRRGWCFFESCVSGVAAFEVDSIRDGNVTSDEPSPVPVPPNKFADKTRTLEFTNGRTDADTVIQLYNRIFPKLAEKDRLKVWHWTDTEVNELLGSLPELTALRQVTLSGNTGHISRHMLDTVRAAMKARGGSVLGV